MCARIAPKQASDDRLPFLCEILRHQPDLVAFGGADSDAWEEAMHMLCVDLDISGEVPDAFCNTSSHPSDSLPEGVAFAEQRCELEGWQKSEVQVMEA